MAALVVYASLIAVSVVVSLIVWWVASHIPTRTKRYPHTPFPVDRDRAIEQLREDIRFIEAEPLRKRI